MDDGLDQERGEKSLGSGWNLDEQGERVEMVDGINQKIPLFYPFVRRRGTVTPPCCGPVRFTYGARSG